MKQKLNWSEYQKAIFSNVAKASGNTAIIARAGSSKTTSLVEAIRYIPKGKKVLVAAFNKSIAKELREKISDTITVATLHSLGFQSIRQKFGNVILDTKKCFNIVKEIVGDDYDLILEICRTVSLCKSLLCDTPSKIMDLMDKYGIEYFPFTREDFANTVIKILGQCKKQTTIIDYDDMIYFPFVYGLSLGKYDYIMIDEAQDMSYSQLLLALSAVKENSRVFVFLDDRQAIYGFRGCDIESVRTILEKLNPTTLSLPISYRCPKLVVYEAQKIVPDIQAAPNAIDGKIEELKLDKLLNNVKGGDYIISRTNAPLIKLCLSLLKNGTPANIQGRDIGSNLSAFIKKSKAKTIDKFLEYVEEWKQKETKRLAAEKKDLTVCIDKAETLVNLCDGCKTIKDLKANIEKLFDEVEDKDKVLLGTTHRLKGKEADRVFMLTWTYRKGANEEENNLYYVCISRSKKELYMVRKN